MTLIGKLSAVSSLVPMLLFIPVKVNCESHPQPTRNFDFKFTKIYCKVNPKYFENLTCNIKPKRNSAGFLNLAVDFKTPLDFGWVIIIFENFKRKLSDLCLPGTIQTLL